MILPNRLEGKETSKVLFVFLHGWPDSLALWDEYVKKYKTQYQCLRITYPNYTSELKMKWGMDFGILIENIYETIAQTRKDNQKIIIVGHDWGAIFAYMIDQKYPFLASHIVTLDVGPNFDGSLQNVVLILQYQLIIIFCFLLGMRFAGKFFSNMINSVEKSQKVIFTNKSEISTDMGYFYMYLYKGFFKRFILQSKDSLLFSYKRSCPISFLYGARKKISFHNSEFVIDLLKDKKCLVKACDGIHWTFFNKPAEVYSVIDRAISMVQMNPN